MMAKKPSERYQTAAEVAQSLRLWLINHGYEVPASDTRLPKPVRSVATVDARVGEATVRRGLVSAKALPETPQQAVQKASQTTKGVSIAEDKQHAPNPTVPVAKPLEAANTLPIAKPLIETVPIPQEIVRESDTPAAEMTFPISLPTEEDPRLALIRGGRSRRAPPMPLWVWIVIFGGVLVAVALAIVQFLRR
jgi:hypothetical protein